MSVLERNVEKVKEIIDADEIKSLERMKYRLSDAIREGSKVSDQAYNWTEHRIQCVHCPQQSPQPRQGVTCDQPKSPRYIGDDAL